MGALVTTSVFLSVLFSIMLLLVTSFVYPDVEAQGQGSATWRFILAQTDPIFLAPDGPGAGVNLDTVPVNSEFAISIKVANNEDYRLAGTTVFEVRDQNNVTVLLETVQGELPPRGVKEVRTLVKIDDAGAYRVRTFTVSASENSAFTVLSGISESRLQVVELHNDKFGIRQIFPSKTITGSEWYIDMNDPTSDKRFFPSGNPFKKQQDPSLLAKQPDGSWRISAEKARMLVAGEPSFRDVEITGYVKLVSASDPAVDTFTWYARGGLHWGDRPCEGSALKGSVRLDGSSAFFKKEMWHVGDDIGYTSQRGQVGNVMASSLHDRWIGLKVIIYNTENDAQSKMELWIDKNADNSWRKITEYTDNGGWSARSSSPGCINPLTGDLLMSDEVLTWAGPFVTFRSDGSIFDFKNLSVREIDVGSLATTTTAAATTTISSSITQDDDQY